MDFAGPRFDYHVATSTLDIARDLAFWGAPHGALVTAAHQTMGRGRRGAPWKDEPGGSALMTFVARPEPWVPADSWRAGFLASLACVRALHAAGFARTRVKWPNDLAIGGAKLGGILVEAAPDGGRVCLLIGIGINVEQTSFDDAGFALCPTSLRLEAQKSGLAQYPNATGTIAGVQSEFDSVWRRLAGEPDLMVDEWRRFQMTAQPQRGVRLDTGAHITGEYVDVRAKDGAGLLRCDGEPDLIAVAPAL